MPIRDSLTTIDLGQIKDEFAAKIPACVDIQDVVKNYESLRELPIATPLHDFCLAFACLILSFIHIPVQKGKVESAQT